MLSRTQRKGSRGKRARTGYNPSPSGGLLGDSHTLFLHYSDSFSADYSVSTPAFHTYRANDLYDPDYTSTGHQPNGYDQMALFFNRFCVLRSWIKVTFCPKSSSDTVMNIGGVYMGPLNAFSGTGLYEIKEQTNNSFIIYKNSANYGSPKTVRNHVDVAQYTGIRDPNTSPALSAIIGNSPTDSIYYIVWNASENETDTAAIDVHVDITYLAKWTRPRYLASS